MRIRILARHVVVRMIARNHHDRHERDHLDVVLLELRQDRLQARPSLHRVDVDVLIAELVELCLDHGIVGVGDVRRAVCHEEECLILAQRRELRRDRLDELRHVVRLIFLSLPVHEGGAAGHRLELILVLVVNRLDVGVLHARNDVERDQRDAGVALCLELRQCLLGRRIVLAFLCRDAVDDDMGGKCRDDLYPGVRCLNVAHRRLDRLLTRILERRAEARNNNGILVRVVRHLRVVVLQNADLRCLHECRRRRLDLRIELVCSLCRAVRGQTQDRRARKRSDQHFLPVFHSDSS